VWLVWLVWLAGENLIGFAWLAVKCSQQAINRTVLSRVTKVVRLAMLRGENTENTGSNGLLEGLGAETQFCKPSTSREPTVGEIRSNQTGPKQKNKKYTIFFVSSFLHSTYVDHGNKIQNALFPATTDSPQVTVKLWLP